ncbi:hypothetical protein IX307_001464 [Bacteroides pyogenes]|uniref:OmpA family protein n=1 Tax=Bacteroides pyogenes TaxID=310300 RepID=UPI001BA5668A|nr:DUF3868 domain-containing protein [Bacteroides pyogenes]MBR8720355.1 hypothetical protein [Bacteroides pyogenes]MBR8787140.1 hypothetical protein [Bacteroides pyogenes]MBR8792679.1 hypothetical protein [Bacteroides pyogenes]
MKLKYIHILSIIAATALCIEKTEAQTNYADQISVQNLAVHKKAGVTRVTMDIDLSELDIKRNHLIVLTPVISSLSGADTEALPPVVIKGTTRDKVLKRPFRWKGKIVFEPEPAAEVVHRKGASQSIPYEAACRYADWQRAARLLFFTEVFGCADCGVGKEEKSVVEKVLPDFFKPDYRFAYIVPEVEPVKQRSERHSAHLNYKVGRYDLLTDFENNAAELAKVDKIIQELKTDKDLNITHFTVSGYASPEDTEQRNMLLSQRRAETFARYLKKKHGYTQQQFKVEWFGEDWKGLRKAVAASTLPNKDAIVEIIDKEPGWDARDARLKALDNGETYNLLLTEFYPPLRRNDYDIAFVSRPFNVEEAKQVLKTKPKLLSLNEMFLVAETYPQDSPQYKEVFDIAADTFPESEVAGINAAVGELLKNNPDAALKRVRNFPENDKALNVMGIAHAMKNEEPLAKAAFSKAARKGNADAAHNADQYQKYIEDNL